ncbi:unnamed protein product [Protopolystoma xenopodis]|uniref:Uncharacterized protein n=1 Tax=Protopolystoma xenopodis TaxID=117903 RepID=A0A3S5ADE4_9PLAT|nr:unnamed protein product [Protopolystoma xenopodis]
MQTISSGSQPRIHYLIEDSDVNPVPVNSKGPPTPATSTSTVTATTAQKSSSGPSGQPIKSSLQTVTVSHKEGGAEGASVLRYFSSLHSNQDSRHALPRAVQLEEQQQIGQHDSSSANRATGRQGMGAARSIVNLRP